MVKTLKDIDIDPKNTQEGTDWAVLKMHNTDMRKEKIRQEAIKHIKAWEQELKSHPEYEEVVSVRKNCFKHFFNLSEEDLK